jgi:hypothetical protein
VPRNPHAKKPDLSVSARVIGVVSRPELNGRDVQVLRYFQSRERYEVLTTFDGVKTTLKLKPSNLVWSAGTSVFVVGLQQQPEMNGLRGKIKTFEPDKQRYTVELPSRPRPASVRTDNCQACVPLAT